MRSRLIIRLTGWGLSAAGLAFVAWTIAANAGDISQLLLGLDQPALYLLLVPAYAATLLFQARVWAAFLRSAASATNISVGSAIEAFGRSQIGKYLPGNVMHLVGRHFIGSQKGWPQLAIGVSTFQEVVTMVSVASLILLLGSLAGFSVHRFLPSYLLAALCVLAVMVPALVPLLKKIAGHLPTLGIHVSALGKSGTRTVSAGWAFAAIFLTLSASLFTMSAVLLGIEVDFHTGVVLALTYLVAWLLGLLTPGAPAGLGVREAAILLFLGGEIDGGDAAALSLLFRLVTTLGDITFFAAVVTVFGWRRRRVPYG